MAAHRLDVGQTEEARNDLEALAANDFTDIPRDLMWIYMLARHFENAIHTGAFCRYQPDRPLRWEL